MKLIPAIALFVASPIIGTELFRFYCFAGVDPVVAVMAGGIVSGLMALGAIAYGVTRFDL